MKSAKLLQQHHTVLSDLKNLVPGVSSGSGHRFSFSFWVLKLLFSCPLCE